MPVFSLPSAHGIGTLGKNALEFIDFLKKAGQKYWQMLPLTPTGCGDSPYSSYSVFAGNPYLIDLDLLVSDGLLTEEDVEGTFLGNDPDKVDYSAFHENHQELLRKAFANAKPELLAKIPEFCGAYGAWVENYALYMALKKHFEDTPWVEWEDKAIRKHEPEAVKNYREKLSADVDYYIFEQYIFYKQWEKVRAYAKEQKIELVGDIPIYVALDSADVWAEPYFFQLDEENVPTFVAGVPPDYFSEDGQLWGNPLYDWDKMEKDGYGWWIRRIDHASKLYDVLRIDHFRGLASYWSVKYGAETAKEGQWIKGPGEKFVNVLISWFSNTKFIAEDLGLLTPDVVELLNATKLPGMRVLEFAFDPSGTSSYLPHYYERNCICYTGTHDNATAAGWLKEGNPKEVAYAKKYTGFMDAEEEKLTLSDIYALGDKKEEKETSDAAEETSDAAEETSDAAMETSAAAEECPHEKDSPREYSQEEIKRFCFALIRAGMSSVASVFIAQMQDYLALDNSARINIPGTPTGNWNWKMRSGMLTDELAEEIADMTKLYGRYYG